MGREQLGLHHRIDRGVAGEDHKTQAEQGKRAVPVVGLGQGGEQGAGVQHPADAEEHQQALAPDDVRQPAADRLHQHQQGQGGQVDHHPGHHVTAGKQALHQLRADHRVGVEGQGAAHGHADAQQQRPPLHHEQFMQRTVPARLAAACGGNVIGMQGFVHAPAQPEHHHRTQPANAEGQPPAPLADLGGVQKVEHQQQGQLGQDMATDQGDVVEGGEESAPAGNGGLGHVGGAGAVLATGGKALQQPCHQQHDRRTGADAGGSGGQRDEQRAGGHQGDRDGQ